MYWGFNCLVNSWENKGGLPFASASCNPFQELIDSKGLIDLSFSSNAFTWFNNREGFRQHS